MPDTANAQSTPPALIPWKTLADATAYTVDAWQRSILYTDVMRQRGNQYHDHLQEDVPHVLNFAYEPVLSGHTLERPVNYWLVRIVPPEGVTVDDSRRPFVVVDPRAGHGPGIGGFKAESEVGAALRAGHPCYFVGFLPDPVPGQSVEDVMHAEAQFLETVIALHPQSDCKPAVVANCQAGWQILMTAAMRPELFGPILVAGAPVSYWAGDNPMRYAGGLLGGSWLTALTSDLGAGRFDGAWLVQNFESLNPANTWWGKQYRLYANVDTEPPRYLEFEKYWGGYVYLNDIEIQYIVDNLFIGNRLATAELITSDGVRLDLRNIRSPIIVFCSQGDNITPPGQALGWITDLYRDQRDVLAHDQTIIYAVHESIGHLGIFVSGSVGSKEHREFTDNIDFAETLPAGIYEAVLEDKTDTTPNADLAGGDYVLAFRDRHIQDVRDIVQPDEASERRFATVSRISDMNLGLYRSFLQPWVQATVTPAFAAWNRQMHPLRLAYEWQSDRNPWSVAVSDMADAVREDRQPVADDNPFWQWQQAMSKATLQQLNLFRDLRDQAYADTFRTFYDSPWVQAMAGLKARDNQAVRRHPGYSPEHRVFVEREMARLQTQINEGDLVDAAIRAVFYISRSRRQVDERAFNLIRRLREDMTPCRSGCLGDFKDRVRSQIELMLLDEDAALDALPQLLARADAEAIRGVEGFLRESLAAEGHVTDDEAERLQRVLERFDAVAAQHEEALRRDAEAARERAEVERARAEEQANEQRLAAEKARAEAQAKLQAEAEARAAAEAKAKQEAEARAASDAKARQAAKDKADAEAKLSQEAKAAAKANEPAPAPAKAAKSAKSSEPTPASTQSARASETAQTPAKSAKAGEPAPVPAKAAKGSNPQASLALESPPHRETRVRTAPRKAAGKAARKRSTTS